MLSIIGNWLKSTLKHQIFYKIKRLSNWTAYYFNFYDTVSMVSCFKAGFFLTVF